MNIKVTIKGVTTNGLVNMTDDLPNATHTQFIAYSDEMKARVLEAMAKGANFKIEPTTEDWKGERSVANI